MTQPDVLAILETLEIGVVREAEGKSGLHYEARCPYHYEGTQEDGSPSWSINAETGQHLCFSCGFTGSLAWLIHKVAGTPFEQAERDLRPEAPVVWKHLRQLIAINDQYTPDAPEHYSRGRFLSYDDVPDGYLESRHISRETADAFDIRWDPQRVAWILPIRDPENTDLLLGIQVKGEGEDRLFRNLPIGVPKSSTLFGIEHLIKAYEDAVESVVVVLVESPLDAARLWGLNVLAVASFGAAVSDEQMRLIVRYADRLVFALDNPGVDDAGRKALLSLLGRNQWGHRDRRGFDWSKRIISQVFDYGTSRAKDIGDMPDARILKGLREAHPAITYRVAA